MQTQTPAFAPICATSIASLSNLELATRVKDLARRERRASAELIAHLAELDARSLYAAEGYSSIYRYCLDVLHLSESEAYNRIEAARAVREFPVVLDLLAQGRLSLTVVKLLARKLTPENHRELLAASVHKTTREAEEVLARLAPRPAVAPSVRKLPAPRQEVARTELGKLDDAVPQPLHQTQTPQPSTISPLAPAPARPARRPEVEALAPELYRLQFSIPRATLEKLRLAQDLLRHALPSGDPAAIVDRALDLLLQDLVRKKLAATERPRPSVGAASGSRHIPAAVKRAVWLRDGGRCTFVSPGGKRCNERSRLEFHHIRPFTAGGEATVENIKVLCARHNAYEAMLFSHGPGGADFLEEAAAAYGLEMRSTRRATSWLGAGTRRGGGNGPWTGDSS